jgi:murein DD-endopeptidase MepM/ murein hydrolase activator NlpD
MFQDIAAKDRFVISIFKQGRIAAMVAVAFGFMTMGAVPALANSSAASADITAAARDARTSPISGGDDQFRNLFASWESLDGDDASAPAPTTTIAIPSIMPLASAKLTSNYGMRTHPVIGGRRNHKGVDLAAPTGTPVFATADGIVSRADRFSSYGLYISLQHGAELETRYAHMSRLAVAAGQRVSKGDIIGYVGSTGRSTGPHLHYEVRMAGVAVNPIPYMVESDAQQAFALAMDGGGQGGPE